MSKKHGSKSEVKRVTTVIKQKQPKSKGRGKSAPKAGNGYVKKQNAFDARVSAFGYKAGYGSDRGMYVERENGFKTHHRYAKALAASRLPPRDEFLADATEEFCEVVATIYGSTTFSTRSFAINPGQAATFPILNALASKYERYSFDSCCFELAPAKGGLALSGRMALSCDLEGVNESEPTNLNEVLNNSIHADGVLLDDVQFEIAGVVRHQDAWWVRSGLGFPAQGDMTNTDVGRLYVSSFGCDDTSPIAYLKVKGRIQLYDRLQEPVGPPRSLRHTFGVASAITVSAVPITCLPTVAANSASGWAVDVNTLVCPRTSMYQISGVATFVSSAFVGFHEILTVRWAAAGNQGFQNLNAQHTNGSLQIPFFVVAPMVQGDLLQFDVSQEFASGTGSVTLLYSVETI